MIYKFKLEVYNDDNEFVYGIGKESGSFWWALQEFMIGVMLYASRSKLSKSP